MNSGKESLVCLGFFKPGTFQCEALFNDAEKEKIHPGRFLGLQGAAGPQTEMGPCMVIVRTCR